ncbi:DUF998 domain-containing protein [Brevundimonas sp.]|uniref:DUF998 domain-containing protein n=1 Tax=Brevundimonas sp. TaxID=1871086 RepID=UPI0025C4245C|nr:DUF998 domain-containing protein [Brevundimonas sp.]
MFRRLSLSAGVAAPLIYLVFVFGGQWLAPGYDPATRMISELGMAGSPAAGLFNAGLLAAGALTVLAAAGFAAEFARLRAPVSGGLAALAVAVFGASILIGGLFPLQDERHLAWGTGFAVQVAPLLTLIALRGTAGLSGLKIALFVVFVAVNALLAVLFGVGDLVDGDTVGLWQRAYGLAIFPWIGVTALALLLRSAPARGRSGAALSGAR